MSLLVLKSIQTDTSGSRTVPVLRILRGAMGSQKHVTKQPKKRKYWHIYVGLQSRIGKCSTWKGEQTNYETRLEAKVTTFRSKRL